MWVMLQRRMASSTAAVVVFTLLCAIAFVKVGTPTRVQAETPVSVDQLQSTIKGEDPYAVVLLLSKVRLLRFEEGVVPFLVDLWEGREDKYPELPWSFVKSDLVRPAIGGALLTLARAMIPEAKISHDEIHNYALDLLDKPDPVVVGSALSILGSFDEERDVPRILSVAYEERIGTFRLAVITLALMCNSAASKALEKLERAVTVNENRSFIINTRQEWEDLKRERGLCGK